MLCFKQRDWHSARASSGGGDLKNKRVPALAQGVIHLTFYRFKTVDEEYVPRAFVKKNMVIVKASRPATFVVMTDRYHLSCWHVFCCLTRISAYAKNSYTRITRTSAFGYLSYRMGCRPVAGINLVGEISTSSDPGHTSLHARRISRLKSGWIRWNSTGLPAKHTITAHTELSMMLNKTVESTIPTMNPILKKQKKNTFSLTF